MGSRFTTLSLASASVAVTTVVAAGAVGVSRARAEPSAGCALAGTRIAQTDTLVVHARAYVGGYQRLEVCRRRSGERSVLVRGNYYGSLAGRRTVTARGNTVAFAQVSRDDGADGDIPFTFVTVWRSAQPTDRVVSFRPDGDQDRFTADAVTTTAISRHGRVAWISCTASSERQDRCFDGVARRVMLWDANTTPGPGHVRQLAFDRRIGSQSLRIDDARGRVRWMTTAGPRSAALSAP